MATKSIRELAHALPEGERRALLAKIQKSLQINDDDQISIYHSRGDSEVRKAAIRNEWQKMSIWSRIVLFFRKLFSTKTEDELIQVMSLERIQRKLHSRDEELVRFEGRYLQPGFAELVYQLYLSLLPLINIFRKFWKNPELLQGLVEFVLDRKIPNAKSSIFRFITFDELQALFEKFENKDAIKRELVRTIDVYLENIPPEVFREIEEGIFPLYYYKELVLFTFEDFFQRFSVDVLQVSQGGDVNFKPAKADPLMPMLEHLYYASYAARRAQAISTLHEEVFIYFSSMTDRPRPDATMLGSIHDPSLEPPHEDLAEADEGDLEELPGKYQELSLLGTEQRKIFKEISDAVETFWRHSNLGNIIRFFRGDPFYRFIAYAPRLNVKEFYQSALQLKVLEELDEQYANVRREVINHKKTRYSRGVCRDSNSITAHFSLHPTSSFRCFDTWTALPVFISFSFIDLSGTFWRPSGCLPGFSPSVTGITDPGLSCPSQMSRNSWTIYGLSTTRFRRYPTTGKVSTGFDSPRRRTSPSSKPIGSWWLRRTNPSGICSPGASKRLRIWSGFSHPCWKRLWPISMIASRI
jgi:hypothetical protein